MTSSGLAFDCGNVRSVDQLSTLNIINSHRTVDDEVLCNKRLEGLLSNTAGELCRRDQSLEEQSEICWIGIEEGHGIGTKVGVMSGHVVGVVGGQIVQAIELLTEFNDTTIGVVDEHGQFGC
jgi:hypothetical protein